MKTINISLGERSYPIVIGTKLEGLGAFLKKKGANGSIFVITNNTVAKLYLGRVISGLKRSDLKYFPVQYLTANNTKT